MKRPPAVDTAIGVIALGIAIVRWSWRFLRGARGEREAPPQSERRGSAQPWTWN